MRYAEIELKGAYREIGPQIPGLENLFAEKSFQLDHFFERVHRISRSRRVRRVLVRRFDRFSPPPFAALEEIRSGLQRLTEAGKEVYYYSPEYEQFDCVLASACKHRLIHPMGTVSFLGIAAPGLFFKRFLDKHEIGVEVIRRGRYKSAADSFRAEEHDAYSREQLQYMLDGAVESMREMISKSPITSRASGTIFEEMLDGRVYTAPHAKQTGLVDNLITINELTAGWRKEKVKKHAVKLRGRFGRGPRIAVLVFEGFIIDGDSRHIPWLGQAIGDRSMAKSIRALRENRHVKAVVFRVNSGGGSALASESIQQELALLHKTKPLVISMGPVAGSGGYWISTTGRQVIASPTTITGSIGVVSSFFDISKLLVKYGITIDSIKSGELSDFGSTLRGLTDQERATIDGVVEFLYQGFVQRVATARGMTPDRVHELGEGRVWLGNDAHRHGLVDELGGLHMAINHAKAALKTNKARVSFGPKLSFISNLSPRRSSIEAEWPPTLPLVEFTRELGLRLCGNEQAPGASPLAIARACLTLHGKPFFW